MLEVIAEGVRVGDEIVRYPVGVGIAGQAKEACVAAKASQLIFVKRPLGPPTACGRRAREDEHLPGGTSHDQLGASVAVLVRGHPYFLAEADLLEGVRRLNHEAPRSGFD